MKTQKELKSNPWADAHKYADSKYHMEQGDDVSKYERYEEVKEAFEAGYNQCQEDIGKELEALRAAIRKNTWYDIDGNAQVGLYAIDNNLLNKQD